MRSTDSVLHDLEWVEAHTSRTSGLTSTQEALQGFAWAEGNAAGKSGKPFDPPYDEVDWLELAAWEDGWEDGRVARETASSR